jgi:hypothetical protein
MEREGPSLEEWNIRVESRKIANENLTVVGWRSHEEAGKKMVAGIDAHTGTAKLIRSYTYTPENLPKSCTYTLPSSSSAPTKFFWDIVQVALSPLK